MGMENDAGVTENCQAWPGEYELTTVTGLGDNGLC